MLIEHLLVSKCLFGYCMMFSASGIAKYLLIPVILFTFTVIRDENYLSLLRDPVGNIFSEQWYMIS